MMSPNLFRLGSTSLLTSSGPTWPDSDLRPLPGLLGLAFGQTRIFSSLQFPLPS